MKKTRKNGKRGNRKIGFPLSPFPIFPCSSRGSAAVELLVLLPVLLLIVFAMMYVGELTLFKVRTHYGGEFAMDTPGDQSEAAAVRGTVTDEFYPNRTGDLAVAEQPTDPADMPDAGEVGELFDEMCQVTTSVTASGRYVFENGQLRFVVTTHESESMSKEGRYVERYGLRDDHIPELTTDLLQDWQDRNLIDLTYSYAPGYIKIGQWPLDAVDLSTRFQSTVRGTREREVVNPPAGMNHTVETLTTDTNMPDAGRPAGYPDFSGDESFWEPN